MTFTRRPKNALFGDLSDQRRRDILSCLQEMDDDAVGLAELSERVMALEADPDSDSDAIAISLHHVHLPKLAESSVLDYDARSNVVRYYGPAFGANESATVETVGDFS